MASRTSRKAKSFSTTEQRWRQIEEEARVHNVPLSAIVNEALDQYFQKKVARSSWETTDEGQWYDRRKFYTYSEDKKGHSSQVRIRVPKNLSGQVHRIIGTGIIPELRSVNDFLRDAITHRAYEVAQWIDDGELKAEVHMMALRSEEARVKQTRLDAEALIGETRENLESAYRRGDFEWIVNHIGDLYGNTSAIPELYRNEYVAMLDEFMNKEGVREKANRGNVTRMKRKRA